MHPSLFAFVLSMALTPIALRILRKRKVIDIPNSRSSHDLPTPRGGGLAPAFAATIVMFYFSSGGAAIGILLAGALFGIIGLVEDLAGIPASARLACQAIAAVVVAPLLIAPTGVALGILTIAAVSAWQVSFVNAFNFMDGVNGISVAQCLVAGSAWWIAGSVGETAVLSLGALIVTFVALGFAPFNFPRSKLFLGDTGSYFFGSWLASLVVIGVASGVPWEVMVAPLSVYLLDTAGTLVRRAMRRENLLQPHRDHVYQRLTRYGLSHVMVTSVASLFMVLTATLGLVSLGASARPRVAAYLGIVCVLTIYWMLPSWLPRIRLMRAPVTQ